MTPEQSSDKHGAHEDERTRARREKRATDRALVDERALAGRRLDALLPSSLAPADMVEDTDFPGCFF